MVSASYPVLPAIQKRVHRWASHLPDHNTQPSAVAAYSQDYWAQGEGEANEQECQCSGNTHTSQYRQGHPCHRFFSFACLRLPRKHLEQAFLWAWPAGPHYSPPHVQLAYEQHRTSALGTAPDSGQLSLDHTGTVLWKCFHHRPRKSVTVFCCQSSTISVFFSSVLRLFPLIICKCWTNHCLSDILTHSSFNPMLPWITSALIYNQ